MGLDENKLVKDKLLQRKLKIINIFFNIAFLYGVLMGGLLILNIFYPGPIPISPIRIDDFVVSKNSEIILLSSTFGQRIFIYSDELKLKRSFKIPNNGKTLVIDENNKIYVGGEVYDLEGRKTHEFVVKSSLPWNWRLSQKGELEQFNGKPVVIEKNSSLKQQDLSEQFTQQNIDKGLRQTGRLRRIAKPGDILYLERYYRGQFYPYKYPFEDDKGNKYLCNSWFDGIKIYNSHGELTGRLEPPLFLWPFIYPFPLGLLSVLSFFVIVITSFIREFIEDRTKRKEKNHQANLTIS